MKYFLNIIFLVFALFSSCGKDFSGDINDLKDQLKVHNELIANLQKGITISSYNESNDGYTILFSDGKSIDLKNGSTPLIKIGKNLNWFINGTDTGIPAIAKNGVDGYTPKIEIISGYWHINSINTNVKAEGSNGKDGSNAAIIQSVYITETGITFNFSDGTSIEGKFLINRIIATWGDSLTAGAGGAGTSISTVLKEILGDTFTIHNFGVGGENSLTIAARQGGVPMRLDADVNLPNDNTPVVIGNRTNSNLKSTWNDRILFPLLQSTFASNATINECVINGINVVLKWTGTTHNDENGTYTIQRVVKSSSPTILKSGSILYTAAMRFYRDAYANVFFIGQNGGYSSNEDLVAQYKAMISFSNSNNYLILGLTSGTESSRKSLELLMTREFGARYVNLREYLATYGLADAGIEPTISDLEAINKGSVPPSLLNDAVHFNAIGYRLIGEHVHRHFRYLGVF